MCTVVAAIVAIMLAAPHLRAMFIAVETENVPIDRVLETLERRLSVDPSDVKTRLNLARLHSMAWATQSDTTPAIKRRVGPGLEVGDPYWGPRPGFQGVQVQRSADPEVVRVARQHLKQAIAQYAPGPRARSVE